MHTICYYPSADLDGHASAAIIKKFNLNYVELRGIDFGYDEEELKEELEELTPTDTVFLVDFSLPMDLMSFIKDRVADFHWIDHHATAIKAAEEAGFTTRGLLRDGTAASKLCWEYTSYREEVPTAVEMIAAYDVWDQSGDWTKVCTWQRELNFNLLPLGPDSEEWGFWLEGRELPNESRSTLAYVCEGQNITREAKKTAFLVDFAGHTWVAGNGQRGSLWAQGILPYVGDDVGVLTWVSSAKGIKVGLYSGNPGFSGHCGEIASTKGGGGHKGAAGFTASKDDNAFYKGFENPREVDYQDLDD